MTSVYVRAALRGGAEGMLVRERQDLPDAMRTDNEPKSAHPRTDWGTIVLHWLTAVAMVTSLVTGLRIAADAPQAPISQSLSPILPQGEIWTFHFAAGLLLFFCCTAYLSYMHRGGLKRRNAPKRLNVLTMPATPKMHWGAVNVGLHWLLYLMVTILTVTGVILYVGHGGWWVVVHTCAAFSTLAYILVHVFSHFSYGGLAQLLLLFRPAKLVPSAWHKPYPPAAGLCAGLAMMSTVAVSDLATRDVLTVSQVGQAPKLDGHLDEAVWQHATPVIVQTQQGVNLEGGLGETEVEIRAVRDHEKIYFAFRWQDPGALCGACP